MPSSAKMIANIAISGIFDNKYKNLFLTRKRDTDLARIKEPTFVAVLSRNYSKTLHKYLILLKWSENQANRS